MRIPIAKLARPPLEGQHRNISCVSICIAHQHLHRHGGDAPSNCPEDFAFGSRRGLSHRCTKR